MSAAVVAAMTLAGAGCGGHDTEPAAAPEPSAEATVTRSAFATSEHCDALTQLPAQVSAALSGQGDKRPESVLQSLAASAPDEIRADLEVISTGYAKLSTALADAGASADSAPDPEAVERLQYALANIW